MLMLPEYSVSTLDVIHCGDALTLLKALPSNFVHCLVTSPPYYGLRDYGGVAGQLGLEDTPQAYLKRMVAIFREARRVLRDDGTCWVNMGDSYNSGAQYNNGRSSTALSDQGKLYRENTTGKDWPGHRPLAPGFKPKDLMLMPHRLAIALQDDGWWVRSDIVWHKPNPMPESMTDRPTKSHEYIFLLSKAERYWYDADAVREANSENSHGSPNVNPGEKQRALGQASEKTTLGLWTPDTASGRNRRSVWTVATQPYSAAHFATYPPDLIRPCIRAGCPHRVCSVCGKGWVRVVEHTPMVIRKTDRSALGEYGRTQSSGTMLAAAQTKTLSFRPDCTCDAAHTPGIVLDPFMGSGTTALVAVQEGRRYVGIELNREYIALAKQRFMTGPEKLNAKQSDDMTDLPMFETIESESA